MTRRLAYDIKVRCILNGCDYTARRFLKSPADGFDSVYKGIGFGKDVRYGREFYRLVSCEVSPDQSRPVL